MVNLHGSLKPWDRQPGETAPAYEAAKIYFDMGPGRTQEAVSIALGKSLTLMSRWSFTWDWVARAAALDTHNEAIERRAKEKVAAAEAARWERRRSKIRQREWALAERLRMKAAEMMAHPLTLSSTVGSEAWNSRDLKSRPH